MRHIYLFFVLFSSSIGLSYSQSINILKDRDSLEYIYVYNHDTLVQVNYGYYKPRFYKERQRLLYRNGTSLDSAGNRFRSKPSFRGSTLIGYGYKDYVTQIITWPINGNPNIQPDDRLISYSSNYPLALKKKGEYLPTEIIKWQNDSLKTIIDFENYLGYENPPGIPEEILSLFSLDGQILLETAYCDGGCYSYRYFIVKNKLAKELYFNNLKKGIQTRSAAEEEDFRVNFYFSHYDYDFLMAAVDYGNLPENTDLIFSKDLEHTTYVIKKHQPWEIMGENTQDGVTQFFYLRSKLDNMEKVIVGYQMDKDFEQAAYRILKENDVSRDQLGDFGKDQLDILRNLVFAKHNYAFSSEFYQAYFNLFAFYSDPKMQSSRVKDVNKLLSKVDRDNLAIIMAELKEK